jgi:hypothetical protein
MLKITARYHLHPKRGSEIRVDLTFLTPPMQNILIFSNETEEEEKHCNGSDQPRCQTGKLVAHSFLHTEYAEGFTFLPETAVTI